MKLAAWVTIVSCWMETILTSYTITTAIPANAVPQHLARELWREVYVSDRRFQSLFVWKWPCGQFVVVLKWILHYSNSAVIHMLMS